MFISCCCIGALLPPVSYFTLVRTLRYRPNARFPTMNRKQFKYAGVVLCTLLGWGGGDYSGDQQMCVWVNYKLLLPLFNQIRQDDLSDVCHIFPIAVFLIFPSLQVHKTKVRKRNQVLGVIEFTMLVDPSSIINTIYSV